MNRGEPSPASTPAKATLPQSQATPPTHNRGNDGQTFTSAQKERVNYSNSKEVQQTLNDLDSMIAKRKQELSSITKSGSMSAAHRRKARRTQESDASSMKTVRNLDKDLSLVDTSKIDEEEIETAPNNFPETHSNAVPVPVDDAQVAENISHEVNVIEVSKSPESASIHAIESYDGETSNPVETQESTPKRASLSDSSPSALVSPLGDTVNTSAPSSGKRTTTILVRSAVESISIPSTPYEESSFLSDIQKQSDEEPSPSSTNGDNSQQQSIGVEERASEHQMIMKSASFKALHRKPSYSIRMIESDGTSSDSDNPDNSQVVHPERSTYTVENISSDMDVKHATVQFGHTQYKNVHLRINSRAELGRTIHDQQTFHHSDDEEEQSGAEGPLHDSHDSLLNESSLENNFGIAMKHVSDDNLSNCDEGSNASPAPSDEQVNSAVRQRAAKAALRSSNPASAEKAARSSPGLPLSGEKADRRVSMSPDVSINHHLHNRSKDMSGLDMTPDASFVRRFTQGEYNNNETSPASAQRVGKLERDARLMNRHLSIYMLKNALLKEEVNEITRASEEKFQEILNHMKRLETERDKSKQDRKKAQEELLAEREELLFVRGQLQSKSARVVDVEAELLASQRLVVALQKEAKIWRTNSGPNTPTNLSSSSRDGHNSSSSKKSVSFRFSPPSGGDFVDVSPFQAILNILNVLEATHPQERERLQGYMRESQREKLSLEAQVSNLDTRLQQAESFSNQLQGQLEQAETKAELQVGKMALDLEEAQAHLGEILKEREELLLLVQQLRLDLQEKDDALFKLEVKHAEFLKDYDVMQHLLEDIQKLSADREEELENSRKQSLQEAVTVVKIVAKESDLLSKEGAISNEQSRAVMAGPQRRTLYQTQPSMYIVKTTGYTCYLFTVLVLQLLILGLILMYLQLHFQVALLSGDEDVIASIFRFRSTY